MRPEASVTQWIGRPKAGDPDAAQMAEECRRLLERRLRLIRSFWEQEGVP